MAEVMRIEPEISGVEVVLLGDFNPAIFTPAWFAMHGLLPKAAADTADLQVAHRQLTVFSTDWLHLQVATNRFVADTGQAPHVRVRDLVVRVFREHLLHTPLKGMGINRNVHFRVGSSAERDGLHRLGELQPVTVGSKKRRVGPDGVMVATNGPEGSSRVRERPFREMMERLIANRAALHTRMYTFTSISGIKQGGDQMRWSMDIGRVTGGSYDGLSSAIGFRTQLPELAEDLGRKHRLMSNQYLLTYTPPEGATAQSVIRLLTTRAGVRMTPTRDGKIP